jgi:eukaryotic-like serine/threonine-protein kinase
MTLAAGSKLGPYEIVGQIGAGGMGEVYRVRDLKLGRDVALKVLPEEFFEDADRVARFEREAKSLAALNHPGIATVYSFEEVAGRHILAMELVEGEGLDTRIAGAIPLDETLSIARQIAEALEAAHEKGIVHRDLKPANIKVTPDGKVKLLDFGLAKIFEGDAAGGSSPSLTHSPTLTGRATAVGVILGTAAYMSPEQARGKTVDKRTDIWAFGCVLYEMLTGRRLFHGEDVSETLAAVLRADPDWNALPAGTAPAVRRLLHRCLERDPRRRLRHIGDASIEIDEALAGPSSEDRVSASAAVAPLRAWQRPSALLAGALLLAGLSGAAAWVLKPSPIARPPIARFALTLPASQNLSGFTRRTLAISPDGTRIAYTANESIFVRDLDSAEPRLLTTAAMDLAFSPDGEWLAFTHRGSLAKIRASGGAPETLLANVNPTGTSWAGDGAIVFADSKGLQRVPAAGGKPELLFASVPPVFFSWPQVLPGGRFVLYTEAPNGLVHQGVTVVRALDGSDRRAVLQNSFAASYAGSGHLVYAQTRGLMAVRFDLAARRVSGAPVPLAESARFSPVTGGPQFAFSESGTLVHALAGPDLDATQLVWVDREGKVSPASRTLRVYSDLRLSRDGQRVAMHLQDEGNDVWISDLSRGTFTRLTFEPMEDETPVWSPDNRQVAYAASRAGQKRGVYRRAADGGTAEELIALSDQHSHVMDWTPDGRALVVEFQGSVTGNDLMLLDLETRQFRPLIQTRFNEHFGRFSPDGKWFAYGSDESGRDEIYVQPFPSLNARVQVSTEGGGQPIWSHDGRELFYRAVKTVMAATVTSQAPLTFAPPRVLFADRFEMPQAGSHVSYDVAKDGRFLMIAAPEGRAGSQSEIHVVLNWFEELRRLAPAGK